MGGEFQYDAFVTINVVFGVGGGEDSHNESLNTKAWLNNVGNESFLSALVAIFHVFARFAGDIAEVKIGTIGNAHEFFATNWIIKFNINGTFGIMGAVLRRHFEVVNFVFR